MTRKQAISEAISILSKDSSNDHIVKKLHEILLELPMSSWTQKSVIDAIDNYAIEHHNTLPYERELTSKNHMPSNTVICSLFGISAIREFYAKYFPNYFTKSSRYESPYAQFSQEDFKNIFIKNYTRIKEELCVKYVCYHTYNLYRDKKSPCANTIMRNCKCDTYKDLLISCKIKQHKKEIATHVSITYKDDDNWHEEMNVFFTEIKENFKNGT